MPHWIITNRSVARRRVGGALKEVVVEPRSQRERIEGLPTFRVATFDPPAGDAPSDDQLRAGVSFARDRFFDDYEDVDLPSAEPARLPGSKRMFASLYQAMASAPEGKGDTLFFIHGFNYSYPDAVRNLHRLHRLYVQNSASPISNIVFFTWPSWGSMRKYKKDQEIALPSGRLLGRVFHKTVQLYRDAFSSASAGGRTRFCGRRIHLAAHSMGNQVLEEFVRAVGEFEFMRVPIFGETLLLNADEDWTALEPGRPMHGLPELAERVHVYTHRSDDALRISEWTKNSEKRLGRSGPKDLRTVPTRTLVVDCSKLDGRDMPAPSDDDPFLQSAARVLDTSCDDDDRTPNRDCVVAARERYFDHWGYLNRPEVVADVTRVLAGVSSSEFGATRVPKDGPRYLLTSGAGG